MINFTYWKDRNVMITGAGGFIGSHLTERLVELGAKVRAFVRYTSRADVGLLRLAPVETLRKIEVIAGDLRDPQAIQMAVCGMDTVFHLGALISIPYSYQHPYEVAETNMMGTLNMLLACRAEKVTRLIHTSTSEVYGTALRVPIDEDHPLQGQSPYSASKIGADKLAESFYCAYGLPVVTVRPFNTYGPRQSARAVIPTVITQALTRDQILVGNLDTRRDFTYVSDTVNGFLCAAQTPGVEGQVYNLGTSQEIRIGDLVKTVIRLVNRPVEIVIDPQRLRPDKSEVLRLLSDNSRARAALGWQPLTSLEDGLQATIDWISSHTHYFRIGTYEL